MKQTAVEWLKKELEDYGSNSHLSLDWTTFDELIKQAKEMEKQQQDEFAIGFAEWFSYLKYNESRYKTNEELLEIYKKEKGL
jgi:hypothetical protein